MPPPGGTAPHSKRTDGSSLEDTAAPVSVHLTFIQVNYVRRATDVERVGLTKQESAAGGGGGSAALARTGAYACFALCAAAVTYGIYLIVV